MQNDLKDLPPEERLKKLKVLEKEKKKEIEEAKKLIKESEDEITAKANFKEKVPIPQVAVEKTDGLSDEEKVILREHKGLNDKVVEEQNEDDAKKEDLEHLAQQQTDLTSNIIVDQYLQNLSQQPVQNIYDEMSSIKEVVEDKGYLNKEEEQKIAYLSSAMEMKMNDVNSGRYSLTEEVALVASVTKQMGARLRNFYRS